MTNPRAVFTSLTGEYEKLNEFELDKSDGVDRICFTDDPMLTSSTWRMIHVPLALPSDPMRSQRVVKILGHPELDQYSETLYVDNSVRLIVSPKEVLDSWLEHADLAIPRHSFRETVAAEFTEVRALELDTYARIDEQREHYEAQAPQILGQRPFWNGMIARRRSVPNVRETMELWMMHVLRYSRRDQLSINFAIAATGIEAAQIPIDNHSSFFHEWPILIDRKTGSQMGWRVSEARVYDQLDRVTEERDQLQANLDAVRSSTSWRWTSPLRGLSEFLRPPAR